MDFSSGMVLSESNRMNTATSLSWPTQQGANHTEQNSTISIPNGDSLPSEETLLQAQRWEAVGRLTGGVVHDFNNLLTGVMLYCDLLLCSLDARDRRRRYADEIAICDRVDYGAGANVALPLPDRKQALLPIVFERCGQRDARSSQPPAGRKHQA